MTTLSLRARLTLWYSVALLLVLVLFGAAVVWQQERIGLRRIDRELDELTTTLGRVVDEETEERAPAPEQEAIELVAPPGRALAILSPRGTTIAAAWNGLTLPARSFVDVADLQAWSTTAGDDAWRVSARRAGVGPDALVLLAATPLTELFRERRELLEAMAVGVPLALVIAATGGLWLASVGLRPITAMATRASETPLAGMADLGESGRSDELGQLARAFNGLVARLRAALQTQRQFMADASHELRTPVSVLRSAADVTLSREHRDEHEYREALTIVDEQTRRVARLVDDMLVLARADGGYPLQPVHLYLNELAGEVRRTLQLVAAERQVSIHTDATADIALHGDEDLLRRMLLNLVHNAVQHAPPHSTVTIAVRQDGHRADVRITNVGVTIAEGDRERIFERFVQLDPARRKAGSGLGLPIARWIAEAHGGTLVLESSDPSATVFVVSLPLQGAARLS